MYILHFPHMGISGTGEPRQHKETCLRNECITGMPTKLSGTIWWHLRQKLIYDNNISKLSIKFVPMRGGMKVWWCGETHYPILRNVRWGQITSGITLRSKYVRKEARPKVDLIRTTERVEKFVLYGPAFLYHL